MGSVCYSLRDFHVSSSAIAPPPESTLANCRVRLFDPCEQCETCSGYILSGFENWPTAEYRTRVVCLLLQRPWQTQTSNRQYIITTTGTTREIEFFSLVRIIIYLCIYITLGDTNNCNLCNFIFVYSNAYSHSDHILNQITMRQIKSNFYNVYVGGKYHL